MLDEITLAIGVIVVLLGLAAFRRTSTFITRCRTTTGRISSYTTEDSEEGVYHFWQIRFTDASGIEHEIRGARGLRAPPDVGATMPITYDPAYPTNAWVSGTSAPWVIPWAVTMLGLATIAASFVIRAEGG